MTKTYEMRLRDVWDILYRRRGVVLGTIAVGLALGMIVSLLKPTMYRASATVTLDRVPPVVLLSPPGFVSSPPEASAAEIAFPDVAGLVELANSAALNEAAVARLTPTLGVRTAKAALARLRVKQVRQSPLLQITVDHPNRAVAATAANTAVTTLVDMDLRSRRGRATELRQAIEQQLTAAIPKLQESENALTEFRSRHGDAALANQTTLSVNRLAVLETELADVRMQQQEARARIDAGQRRLTSQSPMAPISWVPSPLITTLENQMASEEVELSGMKRQFTPKYPALIAMQAKIQETKNRLDAELARSLQADHYGLDPVYQQLAQQLRQDQVTSAAYDAREHALSDAIKAYDQQLRQLPARELEQVRLARAAKQAEEVAQILSEKLQQARIAEASVGSAIRVVGAAQEPSTPARSRWLNLLLGAIVGLAAGVGGAFAKELVNDPIKSAGDVESVLRVPVLASVPRLKPGDGSLDHQDGRPHLATSPLWYTFPGLRSAAAQVDAHRRRARFAEAFRYLRTNLLSQQRAYRTLLVTSPGPSDGRNTVAANLAIAMAQLGRRVWLVECDLREPTLDRVCAFRDPTIASPAGLAELLDGGASPASVLRHTAVDNLWVLPAGTNRDNPSERLASEKMRAFLTTRHADVDVLIAVAPPVLPVTDAAVLAPLVDGVILVVNVGVTPREAAWRAQQQLQSVGARVLGAVVTGAPIGGPGAYENYYATYYRTERCAAWHFGPEPEPDSAQAVLSPSDTPPDALDTVTGDSASDE